jgi:hypothetical protein
MINLAEYETCNKITLNNITVEKPKLYLPNNNNTDYLSILPIDIINIVISYLLDFGGKE